MTIQTLREAYGHRTARLRTHRLKPSGVVLGLEAGERAVGANDILMVEVTAGKSFILGHAAALGYELPHNFYPLSACCLGTFVTYEVENTSSEETVTLCSSCVEELMGVPWVSVVPREAALALAAKEPTPLSDSWSNERFSEATLSAWLERLGLNPYEAVMVAHRVQGFMDTWNGRYLERSAWDLLLELGACFG